jgi:uncharacterized membrane protein
VRQSNQRYERPSSDFDRVGYFSDVVFAIALTLLVVGIGVPKVVDTADLADELRNLGPEVLSFFISFTVIGFYWKGQHASFAQMKAVNGGYITLNLVYLALIAFLPFPTALVGSYEEEPITVVIYAITLGAASAMELVMFLWCSRYDLFREPIPPEGVRFGAIAQLIPVFVIIGSIPLAFVSSTLTLLSWISIGPLEALWERFDPHPKRGKPETPTMPA